MQDRPLSFTGKAAAKSLLASDRFAGIIPRARLAGPRRVRWLRLIAAQSSSTQPPPCGLLQFDGATGFFDLLLELFSISLGNAFLDRLWR